MEYSALIDTNATEETNDAMLHTEYMVVFLYVMLPTCMNFDHIQACEKQARETFRSYILIQTISSRVLHNCTTKAAGK